MIYLIIIFTSLFFLLAMRRLNWAVMLLIATLPAYLIRFCVFGLPSTLLEVMIWIVFTVWLIKNYRFIFESLKLKIVNCKLKISHRYPFDWEIVLLLLIALAAAGVAGFSSASLGIWKAYFFEPALFFIVVLNVMKGGAGRNKILWSLAVSALAVSALAIYQKITGQLIDNPLWAAAETRRVVSFFGYPNAVGLYLGPLTLLFTGWFASTIINTREAILFSAINSKSQAPNPKQITSTKSQTNYRSLFGNWNFKTLFIVLTIIASLLSIYFAKSKGALMGVAAGLILFGLLAGKKIKWAAVVVILVAAAGILIYPPARKLAYGTATFKTLSGQIRLAGWRDSWNMLKDGRIITGAGLANYQKAVGPYHQAGIFFNKDSDPDFRRKIALFNDEYKKKFWQPLEIYLYPHNIFLNFWSELGLAGVLLFIWVIGKFLVIGIWSLFGNWKLEIGNLETQKNKYIVLGLLGAMTVIVIHGVVDVPYFKNDLAVMFWILVAMLGSINLENKYAKNNLQ